MIAELWNTIATVKETTLEQRAHCRLAECWRDLHGVGQTVTVGPEWYPIGGRALLGMDPDHGCGRERRPCKP